MNVKTIHLLTLLHLTHGKINAHTQLVPSLYAELDNHSEVSRQSVAPNRRQSSGEHVKWLTDLTKFEQSTPGGDKLEQHEAQASLTQSATAGHVQT